MKALLFLLIILTSLVSVPHADARTPINTDWCDAMFAALAFQEVPPTIEQECRPRFQWNVNRIKRSFINNSKSFN